MYHVTNIQHTSDTGFEKGRTFSKPRIVILPFKWLNHKLRICPKILRGGKKEKIIKPSSKDIKKKKNLHHFCFT